MTTLLELFTHELQDLYSAENQLLQELPKLMDESHSKKLSKAFEVHMREIEKQVHRLEKIAQDLEIDLHEGFCKAMEGLIKESEDILSEDDEENVKDAAIIGSTQKAEHYEISAYGTLVARAELMKYFEAVRLLKESLLEKKKADKKLTHINRYEVNRKLELQ